MLTKIVAHESERVVVAVREPLGDFDNQAPSQAQLANWANSPVHGSAEERFSFYQETKQLIRKMKANGLHLGKGFDDFNQLAPTLEQRIRWIRQ